VAERSEQVAQRAIAEEIKALVGDLELDRTGVFSRAAANAPPMLALALEIRRARDESLLHHPLDDLLDQLLELLPRGFLVRVGRVAEQSLQRLLRQNPAAEQRLENRIVQRLHRAVLAAAERVAPWIAEPAGEQQIGELRHEILEVDLVEEVAGVLCVTVFHR